MVLRVWREFKELPVSWFDGLARILSCVEDSWYLA